MTHEEFEKYNQNNKLISIENISEFGMTIIYEHDEVIIGTTYDGLSFSLKSQIKPTDSRKLLTQLNELSTEFYKRYTERYK